jgi:transcription initiation factor IIF auxiliary subunit
MPAVVHEIEKDGLTFQTKAEEVENNWYDWQVSLANSDQPLDQIREVEYLLHPTFPKRVRSTTDAADHFALKSGGWGEFDIIARVYYRDGDEKTIIVPLKFK